MRINWRRGFLRAWLVLAVTWIGFIGWIEYTSEVDPFTHQVIDPDLLKRLNAPHSPPPGFVIDKASALERVLAHEPYQYGIVLGPPLAVLALGTILGWIIKGFRQVG
jgi:hypothetical protein